jgi:hypothetical protein
LPPSQQIAHELRLDGNWASAVCGQWVIARTTLVVKRPEREAEDSECMQQYFHSPVCPHGVMLNKEQAHFTSNFYTFMLTGCGDGIQIFTFK